MNNRSIFIYKDFGKMIFRLFLKIELRFKVTISWRILVSFRRFFWKKRKISHGEIFEFFIILLFALTYFLMQMARPPCNTPLVMIWGIEQREWVVPSLPYVKISPISIFMDTRCPPKYTSKFLCMLFTSYMIPKNRIILHLKV
jgi:hypothetical protein